MEDWEKKLEKGHVLIRDFYQWMHASKIALMNDAPVKAFTDFISVHTNHQMEEVTPVDLKWFLYDYYIRKYDPNIEPLTPLSFFFQFLTEKGVVKDLAPFQVILNDQARYHKRVSRYPSFELSEERWQAQYFEWMFQMNDEMAEEIIRADDIENLPALHNFVTILRYVRDHDVRLTPANGFIRLSDVRRIGEEFILPIRRVQRGIPAMPRDCRSEEDYGYLYYLDTMARVARYLVHRKGRLHLSAKGRYFLNLPPSARYLRLFCIYWYDLNWNFLYNHPAAEHFQKYLPYLECLLREVMEKEEVKVNQFARKLLSELNIRPTTESPEYFFAAVHTAMEFTILDWLVELGIIAILREKNAKDFIRPRMDAFRVTAVGRSVIEHFFATYRHG